MPYYDYCCKTCGHIQEENHLMTVTPKIKCVKCKKSCERIISTGISGRSGNREVWEYNDVRKTKPKFVKSRDGKTRVRYDSSKHGFSKGTGQ